jgi:hypothetical protein
MPTYTTQPHQVITDAQFDQLLEDGYLILHNYIRGDELRELQEAQRRCLPTWEQVKDNPPAGFATLDFYPPKDVRMAQLYFHPEILKVARRFLKTQNIIARVGAMLARYPGFVAGDPGHIDNGNNSLLPMSDTAREYGQIGAWIHLEEVKAGQAPLMLGKKKNGRDTSKCEPLICPEGTICFFGNYTWHSASDYTAKDGQRFTWGVGFGRADHPMEGFKHYTHLGRDPIFRQAVSGMTPEERVLFRFPPPNHPYYTRQTLAALEEQYPGWNASGAYKPVE